MNAISLKITDETFAGKIFNEISIVVSIERLTVKDIIATRVYAEVEDYNNRMPQVFNGLVQPKDAAIALNGFRMKPEKKVDTEKQLYTALDAGYKLT